MMTHSESTLTTPGQKKAFIRDGALVLYFDNAETPFVARFDLDSLAQANFEVADKHENIYPLTLRDFSGQVQIVGQFATKTDAHQALYAILQALLSHNGSDTQEISSGSCTVWCVFRGLVKWALLLVGAFVLMYCLLNVSIGFLLANRHAAPVAHVQSTPAEQNDAASAQQDRDTSKESVVAPQGLSDLPEGEAVDADSILAPAASTETDEKAE